MASNINSNDSDEQSTEKIISTPKNRGEFRSKLEETFMKRFEVQDDEFDKYEKLIKRSVDCIHVSDFLHDFIFNSSDEESLENNVPPEDKRYLSNLLKKKEKITDELHRISKDNVVLEKAIINKKMQLKDSMKIRKESWNKAVEVITAQDKKFNFRDELNSSDESSDISEENGARGVHKKKILKEIRCKYFQIQEISGILHRLITFSGVKWANKKHLLEVVLCTGKILNSTFNNDNIKDIEKLVDVCTMRLNEVKWKR